MFLFDMHIAEEQQRRIPQFKGQFQIDDVNHMVIIKDLRSEQWKYFRSCFPLLLLAIALIAAQ